MKAFVLWLANIPADPEPPAGSPDSIRTFRASPNLFLWNMVNWGVLQIVLALMLVGLLVAGFRIQPKLPPWGKVVADIVQGVLVTMLVLQSVISGYKQKLDYEMRWYMVTDRSLRVRWGIFFVREVTMTFANIQRVSLSQGPLQKILAIATVEVSTAGGGAAAGTEHHGGGMMNKHSAQFEGVGNAAEIRDLILARLKQYRDAGLGDPDDAPAVTDEHEAAVAVLHEVRKLSAALSK